MNKKWYVSKTVWVNVLAILAAIFTDIELTPETQIAILGVINLILRLVTKEKIVW